MLVPPASAPVPNVPLPSLALGRPTYATVRRVEEITAQEAAALAADGRLPAQADEVDRLCPYHGSDPIPSTQGFRWLVHRQGLRITGFLVFRDEYDGHASRTMRVALHLAGSPRACYSLTRAFMVAAAAEKIPLRAESAAANDRMNALYTRFGWKLDRFVWVAA